MRRALARGAAAGLGFAGSVALAVAVADLVHEIRERRAGALTRSTHAAHAPVTPAPGRPVNVQVRGTHGLSVVRDCS